jgi:hypothetical protein
MDQPVAKVVDHLEGKRKLNYGQNGKGDRPRVSDFDRYRNNYDDIDFSDNHSENELVIDEECDSHGKNKD